MKLNMILKDIKNSTDKGRFIEVVRDDGFTVFLDKSQDELSVYLNHIKLTASKKQVILLTGLIRGLQISNNYAEKHLPEEKDVMGQAIREVFFDLKLMENKI